MKRILILSVGGSPEPIVNAIKKYNPDLVYFFCSSGPKGSHLTIDSPGDPCGDKRRSKCPQCGLEYYLGNPKGKAIAFQTDLDKGRYKILTIEDPDDLGDCYLKLLALSQEIKSEFGDQCEVIANFTGGTKTMSVAVVLAGLMSEEWDLSLNVGLRMDLIKVRGGDVPVVIDKWRVFCQNQMDFVNKAIEHYNYAFACYSISALLTRPVDREMRKNLIEAHNITLAFDLWDKFAHRQALDLIAPHGTKFAAYIIILKKILGLTTSSGYEMVGDLINNAERRATQNTYDDAVARLYRATELLAQIRLDKAYGYKSNNLYLTDLPENLQEEFRPGSNEKGKLLLGLREDYELLAKLNDPVGHKFTARQERIISALTKRNASISAHGLTPLLEDDYKVVKDTLVGFMEEVSGDINVDLKLPQFPIAGIMSTF